MKLNPTIDQLTTKRSWNLFDSHTKLSLEIVHWGVGKEHCNDGHGIWNYYIKIHELYVKDATKFNALWLPASRTRITPDSPERLSYSYFNLPDFRLHGGITFYMPHGQETGHRVVEVGCDYNHIWDQEHGPYCLEEVFCNALDSMNAVHAFLTSDLLD